jgi:hypothetical protein
MILPRRPGTNTVCSGRYFLRLGAGLAAAFLEVVRVARGWYGTCSTSF